MIPENSKLRILMPLSIALGIMLSPESLVILGNGMGNGGSLFLVFLLLAVSAHFLTVFSYDEVFTLYPGWAGETELIRKGLGSIPAAVLPVCSKALFVVCASTGILATAGYVFNETFVLWFPNLGFSFCLLGFLLFINLLDKKVVTTAQIIFVSVTLLGLILLVSVGSLELANATKVAGTSNPFSGDYTRIAFIGLILFIGFELAATGRSQKDEHQGRLAFPLLGAIGLVGVIFSAWGLVSLRYVDMQELAGSTIPHVIAARTILGQSGRTVMGIVVMAGALSAVNALLFSVSRLLSGMAQDELLPSFLAGNRDKSIRSLLLLVLGIAAMMGLGMAGEPVLEIYTRSALLFWLLSYSAVHLSVLRVRKSHLEIGRTSRAGWRPAVSMVGFLAMLAGFVGLLWTDPEPVALMRFMLTMTAAVLISGLAWSGFKRSKKSPNTVAKGQSLIHHKNASYKR